MKKGSGPRLTSNSLNWKSNTTTYRDDPKKMGKIFDFFRGGNPQSNLDRKPKLIKYPLHFRRIQNGDG